MGKAINISLENMNNELNPHEDFDYHSIFKGERLALLVRHNLSSTDFNYNFR